MRDVVLEHAAVGRWLERETPGPEAVLGHVLSTGHGRSWADRWPDPSVLLTETGGNYLLLGDPRSVDPDAVRPLVRGFLAAPPEFVPVLATAFPDRVVWDRVVYRLPPDRALTRPAVGAEVRALTPDDADAVGAWPRRAPRRGARRCGPAAGCRPGPPPPTTWAACGSPSRSASSWSAGTRCTSSASRSPARVDRMDRDGGPALPPPGAGDGR